MAVPSNQEDNTEENKALQTLQSIERELYLFRMEMQEICRKLQTLEEKKNKQFAGLNLILIVSVIVLGAVLITSLYFFFDFLESFSMPKAVPASF